MENLEKLKSLASSLKKYLKIAIFLGDVPLLLSDWGGRVPPSPPPGVGAHEEEGQRGEAPLLNSNKRHFVHPQRQHILRKSGINLEGHSPNAP